MVSTPHVNHALVIFESASAPLLKTTAKGSPSIACEFLRWNLPCRQKPQRYRQSICLPHNPYGVSVVNAGCQLLFLILYFGRGIVHFNYSGDMSVDIQSRNQSFRKLQVEVPSLNDNNQAKSFLTINSDRYWIHFHGVLRHVTMSLTCSFITLLGTLLMIDFSVVVCLRRLCHHSLAQGQELISVLTHPHTSLPLHGKHKP